MARPEPDKLTKKQRDLLKDPRFVLASRAVKPLYRVKKRRSATRE